MSDVAPLKWLLQFDTASGSESVKALNARVESLDKSVVRLASAFDKTTKTADSAKKKIKEVGDASEKTAKSQNTLAAASRSAANSMDRFAKLIEKRMAATLDRMSESTKKVSGDLSKMGKAVTDATHKIEKLNKTAETGNVNGAGAGKGGGGGFLSKIGAFTTGLSGLVGVGLTAAYGLSKASEFMDNVVDAFSQKETSIRTYTTLLGDAKQAEIEYAKAGKLAQKTELTNEQVQNLQQRLMTSGLRGNKLDRALFNATDIVTMQPQNRREGEAQRIGDLFAKIQNQGFIQGGTLTRQAGRLVNASLIKEEIAKELGINNKQVDGALKDKKVSADAFFNSFQRASLRQLNTEKLGQFAVGASGSLAGLQSNQEEAFTNLLRSFDPTKMEGVNMFKDSIQYITDVFTDPDFQNVLKSIAEFGLRIKSLFNAFSGAFLRGFSMFYDKTVKFMEYLGIVSSDADDQSESWGNLESIMKAAGYVVSAVGIAAAIFVKAFEVLGDIFGWIKDKVRLAIASIRDFGAEISETFTDIFDRINSLVTGLVTIIQGALNFSVSDMKSGQKRLMQAFQEKAASQRETYYDKEVKAIAADAKAAADERAQKRAAGAAADKAAAAHKGNKGLTGGADFGGGGKKEKSGLSIGWNFGGSMASAYSVPVPQSKMLEYPAYSIPAARPQVSPMNPIIKVDKIEVIVPGSNLSATEVADAIYLKVSQGLGRLVRAPSAAVL